MLVGQLVFSAMLLAMGLSDETLVIMPALFIVGACWMSTMTTLNATAQIHLPRKFRARGMAAYLMAFALGMALGSAVWGWMAWGQSLSLAFCVAAGSLVLSSAWMHPYKIGSLHVGD